MMELSANVFSILPEGVIILVMHRVAPDDLTDLDREERSVAAKPLRWFSLGWPCGNQIRTQ
jgi:hypothetical protein